MSVLRFSLYPSPSPLSPLPLSLSLTIRSCNAPPALSHLSQYRDDGKDGLKFYTNPDYFFELWAKEQTKQIEKKQKKKAKGARKKKESKKKKVKAVQKKQYAGVDKEFMEQAHLKQGPGDIIIGTPPTTRHSTEIHMREAPPAAPPPPQPLSHAQMAAPTVPPPPHARALLI
ncbi:Wiskott-Aldrich syndrome protein family member 2, partial [Geodia barretti]